jgi:hypothetical protein
VSSSGTDGASVDTRPAAAALKCFGRLGARRHGKVVHELVRVVVYVAGLDSLTKLVSNYDRCAILIELPTMSLCLLPPFMTVNERVLG